MPDVTATSSSISSYLKDILERRRDSIEERIEDNDSDGKLSKKNKASLEKMDASIDEMQKKALADGILDRAEYQRLMRALDTESASLDKILKVKTTKTTANASSGSPLPMQDQDQTLKLIQNMQKRMHETITKALSAGTISKKQGEALTKLETSEQEFIDKAMADGSISKGEFAQIGKAQSALSNTFSKYQKAQRQNKYSGSSLSGKTV
ncbi:MAG: hypothetical protein HY795_08960 [Desulfovibrio sp.]|nr:hypothetical protein [Desulfovibrio sp.]MBI4958860.1 hypothetical protein [Desulfovibrio sp.]